MKKLFAILMSIMMIACFMPTMAFAATPTEIVAGNDGQIKVSGSFADGGTIATGAVTFPEREYQAAPAVLTVTIENTTNAEISKLAVAIDGQGFEPTQPLKKTLAAKVDETVESTTFTVTPKTDLSAGEHTATVKIVKSDDTSGNPLATFTVSFKVTKKKVTVPTAKKGLVYDGNSQTGVEVAQGSDGIYTLTGNTGTDAKEDYSATATLTDSTNYEWEIESGNTSADQTIPWSIAKKNPEAKDFTFSEPDKLTYDGVAKEAKVALKSDYTGAGGVKVKYYKDDKEVPAADVKDPGTYTVKIDVGDGTNFNPANAVNDPKWTFTIVDERGATANVANNAISGHYDVCHKCIDQGVREQRL